MGEYRTKVLTTGCSRYLGITCTVGNFTICTIHKIAYYKDSQIKKDKMVGACTKHGEMRNVYNSLVGKHIGLGEETDHLENLHRLENRLK